ncbi:hypothetical protein GCM10018782_25300 [Streptomyces griseoaurantiacus]|nr:hypothetical protein GCM10018782_25300 [Streptomyces griseoaurantiacus]
MKSRASGTTPLAPSKFSRRTCRPPDGGEPEGAAAGDAPPPGGSADAEDADGTDDGPSEEAVASAAAPEAPLGSGPRSPGE